MNSLPRQLATLLAICIAGMPVFNATANGFALPNQDAFATARGGAAVATADNPSAVYYNPAGITQLKGNNAQFGLNVLAYHISFTPTNRVHTYNEQANLAAVPQVFYTYSPTNLSLSFGLGIYAPFGGNISWPQDTGFQSVALNGKLTYLTINPVVAWNILPSLSIAAGPMINYVDMSMDQGLEKFAEPLINYFRFSGTGWSYGFNVGARWQPLEQLSFGATFRSPAKVTLDGQTEIEDQPFIARSISSANMDLTFPLSVVSGVSYRPTPKWNLEFDASYTDWSSFGSTTIHQANPPSPIHSDLSVTLNWQASWMYEFGVTRYFDNGWHASAGYCFSENSVPNDYYTPLAADMDRHFFSVGTGYKGKHFSLDLAYQFGYGPDHTVTGSHASSAPGGVTGQNGDGTYSFYSNALFVTAGWHF